MKQKQFSPRNYLGNSLNTLPILSLALLFTATSTRADIFMLNLNYREKEVQAVKAAALKTNQKVWVMPDVSDADLKAANDWVDKIDDLQHQEEALTKELEATSSLKDTGQATALQKQLSDVQAQEQAITANINSINKRYPVRFSAIKNLFKDIAQTGKPLTVVLSGHSNGTEFWGAADFTNDNSQGRGDGGFSFVDLKDTFSGTSFASHVAGLYLNGCYTQTPGAFSKWSTVSKQIDFRVGMWKTGPIGSSSDSYELLESLLKQEPVIAAQKDSLKVMRLLKSDYAFLDTNVSVESAGEFYDVRGMKPLAEVIKCNQTAEAFGATLNQDKFLQYFLGTPGYERVPSDPHQSSLRDFYNYFQSVQQCGFTNTTWDVSGIKLSVNKILSLIFFNTVQENACRFYQNDLNALYASTRNYSLRNARPKLPQCNAGASRKDWMDFATGLTHYLNEIALLSRQNPKDSEIQGIFKKMKPALDLHRIISNLDCVPTAWVDSVPANGQKPKAPDQRCLNTVENSN